MNRSFLIAAILNWGVVLALAGVGVDFLTSSEIKPHHRLILDQPYEDLSPRTQTLIMTLMKGTGLVALLGAVSLSVLLITPFRRRENWVRSGLLVIGGTVLIPTLIGTMRVRAETGAPAPWWPHAVMISALIIAWWLTRDFKEHRSTPV